MGKVGVIGGGLVGMSVACGMAAAGREVVVFDEGGDAFRASRGNAGLIWVQGKGDRFPSYAQWTRRSSDNWFGFAQMLREKVGVDVEYVRPGGFHFCISEREMEARTAIVNEVRSGPGANGIIMVDRSFIRDRLPMIGEGVLGASWSPMDGMANPLLLLLALYRYARLLGIEVRPISPVDFISPVSGDRFDIWTKGRSTNVSTLVLAAGLGNKMLGPMVGLDVPVNPVQGQLVVTERIPAFLDFPTTTIRQNATGTVLFGNSSERLGYNVTTNVGISGGQAKRALIEFPHLADVKVIRTWSALRVMPNDEMPIYDQSKKWPGAFVVTCHSGVTLSAIHMMELGPALAAERTPPGCEEFVLERFNAASAEHH